MLPIAPIGFATIVAGFYAIIYRPRAFLPLMLCAMLLGAAAALFLPGIGSVTPGHLFLAFGLLLMWKTPNVVAAARRGFRMGEAGFWLICVCVIALLSAFFLPRFFAGQFDINALSTPENVFGYPKIALRPTNGNVTQSVYMFGDVAAFALFYGLASQRNGLRQLTNAFLFYGTANLAFALVDLLTSMSGLTSILDCIRNANYIVYADASVGEARRIIGSFSEAAAFASATLGIAGFSTRIWLSGYHSKWAAFVSAASIVLLLLSTSTTAYAGLCPCLLLLFSGSCVRAFRGVATRQDAAFVSVGPTVVLSVSLLVAVIPSLRASVGDYLDNVLFSKSMSASGLERARLNAEAMAGFFASGGMGFGLGSVRTASFAVAVLANIGILGALAYCAFFGAIGLSLRRWNTDYECQIRLSAAYGCFALICGAVVSGTTTDLGLAFSAFAAAASARIYPATASAKVKRPTQSIAGARLATSS